MGRFKNELIDLPKHKLLISQMVLRDADALELETVLKVDSKTALLETVERNLGRCYIAYCDDQPFLIHGSRENGLVWAVGTDLISTAGPRMYRFAKGLIEGYQREHEVLHNYIDRRNTVHQKWLQRNGFVFTGDWTLFSGQPFIYFERTRRHN